MAEYITLNNPIMINGKEVSEFEYDIDSITVEQYMEVEGKVQFDNASKGIMTATQPEFNSAFHIALGYRAIINCNSSIDIEDLKRIKGRDIHKIRRIGRDFFNDTVQEEDQEETASPQKKSESLSEATVVSMEKAPKLSDN